MVWKNETGWGSSSLSEVLQRMTASFWFPDNAAALPTAPTPNAATARAATRAPRRKMAGESRGNRRRSMANPSVERRGRSSLQRRLSYRGRGVEHPNVYRYHTRDDRVKLSSADR